MLISDYIYEQVDGFNKAGKRLVPPKNEAEKSISKVLGIVILIVTILLYLFLFNSGINLPLRIHIRALIYLVPMLGAAYKLYRGISISWIIQGIIKYWMIPLMLVWIYILVMNMFYVVFFGGDINPMLISGGWMSVYTAVMYGIYFLRKASSSSGWYYIMVLFMTALFIGGLAMILWGNGTLDWFHDEVLGW